MSYTSKFNGSQIDELLEASSAMRTSKEDASNKVTSLDNPSDVTFPTSKAVAKAIQQNILKSESNFIEKYSANNIIDNTKLSIGYIDSNGYFVGGNNNFLASDYSVVPKGAKRIIFKGHAYGASVCYAALYDSNLLLLKSQKITDGNRQIVDLSDLEGVKYFRYSVHKNSVSLRAEVAESEEQNDFIKSEVYNPISGYTQGVETNIETNKQAIETIRQNIRTTKKIICIGDSLTANGDTDSYPAKLQNLLGDKYKVYNFGIGGDSSMDICVRLGAIPAETSVEFTIPKEKDTIFSIPEVTDGSGVINHGIVSSITGTPITIYTKGGYYGSKTITPLTINDITLEVQNSTINGQIQVKTIEDKSNDTMIKKGSIVIFNGYKLCQDADLIIVNMGANGGYDTNIDNENSIVEQFKLIQSKFNCNLLFVTPHTINMYDSFRDKMKKTFGCNYLDTRLYFSTMAIYDAVGLGLISSVTDEDISDMEKGNCPKSLLADNVHFNDIGRTLLSNIIFKRLKTLGFINE